jgi:hypothetical protein
MQTVLALEIYIPFVAQFQDLLSRIHHHSFFLVHQYLHQVILYDPSAVLQTTQRTAATCQKHTTHSINGGIRRQAISICVQYVATVSTHHITQQRRMYAKHTYNKA